MKTKRHPLKAIRQQRGLSQEQLAALAGVNASTVCRIERGHETKLSTLRAVARALRVPVAEIAR